MSNKKQIKIPKTHLKITRITSSRNNNFDTKIEIKIEMS